jgi:hypothetical protein
MSSSIFENIIYLMSQFSIVLLAFGIFIFFRKKEFKSYWVFGTYLIFLFLLELFSKKIGALFHNNNLIVFSVSALSHFVFLTLIYFRYLIDVGKKTRNIVLGLGIIPLLISNFAFANISAFQSYDRAIYSLTITVYTFILFYEMVKRDRWNKHTLLFNSAVLLFFSLDVLLAVGTNYLVNEKITFVSWFWTGRAVFLQLFYGTLIYYLWKLGRTH